MSGVFFFLFLIPCIARDLGHSVVCFPSSVFYLLLATANFLDEAGSFVIQHPVSLVRRNPVLRSLSAR